MVVKICQRKLQEFLKEVTVEPVLFLYMLAIFSQYTIFQDLVYSRVCLEKYDSTICNDLQVNLSRSDEEGDRQEVLDYVQGTSSYWILLATASTIIPSIFISIYLGSWSDQFGRKWPVAIPPLGGVMGSIVYIVISFNPSLPIGWICLASLFPGLTGGFVSCMMSCATYISSTTTQVQRTMRLSRLEAMTFLGGTLGPFISGSFFTLAGHGWVFVFMMVCYLSAFFYVLLFLTHIPGSDQIEQNLVQKIDSNYYSTPTYGNKSSLPASTLETDEDRLLSFPFFRENTSRVPIPNDIQKRISLPSISTNENEESESLLLNSKKFENTKSCCRRYFGSKRFLEAVSCCFRLRDGDRRFCILLVIFAGFVTMVVTAGEVDVAFLFVKDKPLGWSPQLYSYYVGYKYGLAAFVLLVVMPVFQKLKLTDATVSIIGIVSRFASLVLFGLSSTTMAIFFAPLVGLFSNFTIPCIRSLLSKLVNSNEQGKIFALVAVIEDICTLCGSILFNTLYPLTRPIFHGFIFQLAAFLLIVPFIILGGIHKKLKEYTNSSHEITSSSED